MPDVLFNFDSVTKSFSGRRVLDRLSWQLNAGDCAVLLGPSGSGKTVFLHTLLGLIRPDEGAVTTPGLDGDDLFRHAAVMFQEDALLDERTVEANIALAVEERADIFGGPFSRATNDAIDDVLREVRLDPRQVRRALPSALSGGMRRRVALARALIRKPRVLIADEPTTGLDPASSAAIYDLLGSLIRARGMSAVIITHDPSCASRLGYPVYFFSPVEGRMPCWPNPQTSSYEERHRSLLLWMHDQIDAHVERLRIAECGLRIENSGTRPESENSEIRNSECELEQSAIRIPQSAIDALGRFGLLLSRLAIPPSAGLFVRNLFQWGAGSLPLTALIFILLGVVMQAQSESAVLQYGASRYLPELVALSLLRLAPILTGFLVAGRCGSAISAHTGYMQISGQFRAMRTMRVDPETGLFPPLFWSLVVAVPALAVAGIGLGAFGAWLVLASPLSRARIGTDFFLSDFPNHLTTGELTTVIVKGMLIGAGIALIAFGGGARPKRSPAEVTDSITGGLVAAFIWITIVDTVISLLAQ
ncbi:MAG: ABC transporter permease [Candidatus Sumerlaeia bacterium]